MPCGFKVIHQLSRVLLVEGLNGFDLYNDFIETDEVWLVKSTLSAFVDDVQFFLGDKGNTTLLQLFVESVLVNVFKVPITKRLVDFENRTTNGIRLFLINQVLVHVGMISNSTMGGESGVGF